jgi:hypothetical protein
MELVDHLTLVDAYFEAARWATAAPELRDFHARKVELLEGAFEFRLEPAGRARQAPRDARDLEHVRRLAKACLRIQVYAPFTSWLEGGPGPREQALRDAHEERLTALRTEHDRVLRALFADALVALDSALPERRVDVGCLDALGPAPDPLDFF